MELDPDRMNPKLSVEPDSAPDPKLLRKYYLPRDELALQYV